MADKMDDNLKKAKAYQDSLEAINKRLKSQEGAVTSLANEMGIAFSGFMTQTKKSQEERLREIKLINDAKKSIEGQKAAISEAANEILNLDGAFKTVKSSSDLFAASVASIDSSKLSQEFNSIVEVQARMKELGGDINKLQGEQKSEFEELAKLHSEYQKGSKDFQKENEKHFNDWLDANKEITKILDELPLGSIEDKMKMIESLRKGELDAVEQILATDSLDEKSKQKLLGLTQQMTDGQETLNGLQAESANQMKAETSIRKNMWSMVQKNSGNAFKSIFDHMKQTNQAFKDAQKDFGLVFDSKNYDQMAALTSKAAEFNMSAKDTVELMGSLGEELRTIDTQYLASATEHFLAIQKATGISAGEVSTIAGEMMRAGNSAEEVEQYMEGSNKMAQLFGVNTKKVLQGVARNIDKMRQMGFQGGEESLTRMVATAERLRMNVDEIFDVAAKARTIEGAMDMASQLQLAGGSFAAINPMDLLSAARKGPEELQNILKEMGDDIGSFGEDGKFSFDPVDTDRLQIVADATNMSMDSIQKMIQKNAEDNKKMDFMPDMELGEIMGPDGKPLDQDMMNNMLLDSVDVHGDALEGGLLDEMGIASLEDLTADQAQQLIKKKMDEQATLEEQAKANQSFQESITAFKDSVMNLFTVFQPVLDVLTSFIQTLMGMPGPLKYVAAALLAFVAAAPMLGKSLDGFKAMASGAKGLFGKVKGMVSGKGAVEAGGATEVPGADSTDKAPGGKGETGLERLAKGLKAMGTDFGTVMKGVLATALAGPALLLLLPGIPTLFLMAGVGALGELVESGFTALSNGVSAMGKDFGNVAKGALAMLIVGASLIPFALALQMMSEVGWGTVLMAITMMAAGVLALMAIGMIVAGPGGIALLLGALALVAVGVALMAFGASLMIFAVAAGMMQGLEFGWLGDLGWNLLLAAPGLLLGGIALGLASPFLMMGSIGLMAIATAAATVSGVDWASFAAMGDALMSIVPGLIGFGFAGLMFLNPLLLLGMLLMIGNLAMLAMVMSPLSESLNTGADGLDRFSDGLTKLQAAANSLDLEKLEMLKDLSWSMAMAGMMGGGMGDSISKIAEALAKLSKAGEGGGGKGGAQKIQIDLKLNGRDLQSIIVDDTKIVT
jgi:hypothetical protein